MRVLHVLLATSIFIANAGAWLTPTTPTTTATRTISTASTSAKTNQASRNIHANTIPRPSLLVLNAAKNDNNEEPQNADALLRMASEVVEFSSAGYETEKIQELERALANLIETERKKAPNQGPKPPSTPPSMTALNEVEALAQATDDADDKLAQAEAALIRLRQRLVKEEAVMKRAEEAIRQSREEEETLRKAEEALDRSRKAAEVRKADAIRRTNEAVAEADAIRQEQVVIAKQAFEIEKELKEKRITPRRTINLESLFSPNTTNNYNADIDDNDSTPPAQSNKAPSGIPIIYDWKQDEDGCIVGRVKSSPAFRDGARISTSSVAPNAVSDSIVTTGSGSKYYLESSGDKKDQAQESGTSPPIDFYTNSEEVKTYQEEEYDIADAGPILGDEETLAKTAAAEEQLKLADERREIAKEVREVERLLENARNNEQKLKEAAEEAQQQVENAQQEQKLAEVVVEATAPSSDANQIPRGVPRIISWSMREDGGLSGEVFGSPNSEDGDLIETSPVENGSVLEPGKLVRTVSGSEYILFGEPAADATDSNDAGGDLLSTIKNLVSDGQRSTITLPKLDIGGPKSRGGKSKSSAKTTQRAEKSKPRTTFSLFDMFAGDKNDSKKSLIKEVRPSAAKMNVPKGVPILSRWKVNTDGTITGIVSGSPSMEDGDLVTTSPIGRGRKMRNSIVTTNSGSKYFLS